ncbi:hypothetical protein ACFLYW_01885 [Thermodesulfobacteriota bacterium]
MPVEFKYLDNGLGFGFTAMGNFQGRELIDAARHAYQLDKILRKNKYGIIDYTPVEKFDVSTSDVEAITEMGIVASKIAPDRIIAVVASAEISHAYSRMWQILSDKISWERMVFREKNEAEKWLKKRVMEQFNISITLR